MTLRSISVPMRGVCVGLLAVAAFVWGCGGARVSGLKGAEHYFDKGMRDLEKGRCLKAVEQFQFAVNNYPGSSLAPDAQYYLGEAYFCSQEYVEAVFEFQRLLDTFPASEWADEAQRSSPPHSTILYGPRGFYERGWHGSNRLANMIADRWGRGPIG